MPSQKDNAPCSEWQMTTVFDLVDAEDILDALERQGVADKELVVLGNACFAIRWKANALLSGQTA